MLLSSFGYMDVEAISAGFAANVQSPLPVASVYAAMTAITKDYSVTPVVSKCTTIYLYTGYGCVAFV